MKKLITAAALICTTFLNAQKEGFVKYTITLEGIPAEQAAMMGDMESKVTFKGEKILNEHSSMMYSTKTLMDENGFLILFDMMGNKSFAKATKAELEKNKEAKAKDPKVEYTNETKKVAGYDCKKAVVTVEGKDGETSKMDIWYAEKLPYISVAGRRGGSDAFSGIKGLMLEYSMQQGPAKMKYTASQVSLEKVPDSVFALSTDGYTEKSMDEFKKMGGGK
jgi:GLPGLI family protein